MGHLGCEGARVARVQGQVQEVLGPKGVRVFGIQGVWGVQECKGRCEGTRCKCKGCEGSS